MKMDNVVQFKTPGGATGDATIDKARWKVDIEYRSANGGLVSTFYLEEIGKLQDIFEDGPHFDTIVKCVVTVNRQSGDIGNLTIEQSQLL
jgi:hypothetical protein